MPTLKFRRMREAFKILTRLYDVEAKTMFQFENRLDRHWENHPMKYDFTAEYGLTTGRLGAVRNDEEELPIESRQELQAEST